MFINLYLILCRKKFIIKKKANATAIKAIKAQTILLSFPKPKGIKPIKPPTATLVSLFPAKAWVKAPMKTKAKPMRIIKIPKGIKSWFTFENTYSVISLKEALLPFSFTVTLSPKDNISFSAGFLPAQS